jgi:hypothetical protein
MDQHHHDRIDKGVKRGGRQRVVKRSEVEREARQEHDPETGRWLTAYPPEQRAQIILEAIEGLQTGIVPESVAKKHNIPRSTLYSWLLDNSTAQEARTRFFHYQVGKALHLMEGADNPLDLARWRDIRRAWAETAAVRDPANYGQKHEVTHIQADLGDRLRRARERVIDQDVTVVPPDESKSK